jgi:glycogen debranching enzyme
MSWCRPFSLLSFLLLAVFCGDAQQVALRPVDAFSLRTDGPVLRSDVAAGEPFAVAGPQGVLVGQQQGVLEAWLLPVKLLSHLTVEAEVEGYAVPLDLNSMAREIEVRPDRTTITYSHIAVTLRQIMFAPEVSAAGTGAVVLFQVDAVRPVTLTLRFTPELREMWPKASSGVPSAEWVARGASGFYVLHSDFANFAAAVALPGAASGIMAPYQERPQVHPLELKVHIDGKDHRYYPLLMAVGRTAASATSAALESTLGQLNVTLPTLYQAHAQRYAAQEQDLTSIVTPDAALDADLLWAETSIGQLRARTADGELGLVAGYYASGDSARPGFGWYFGRDTLYTVYAIDSYGDHALARTALEFLLARQRADGKAMHEFSQTAAEVDWASFPYEYAAADATPLLLTAMLDYVRSSGDVAFLRAHRDNVMRAWRFETTHDADGDGVYDNGQGTGWVESWPGGMPKQEVYLALLDEQASQAMAELAGLLDDAGTAAAARARAVKLHATIEREYYEAGKDAYAFSQNNGTLDAASTVYPAVAWWNDRAGWSGAVEHPSASLGRWASHDFSTDWGARDVAESDPVYDPISYHQGSVWPLFTGWMALAEYRAGHPLAGYASTMQNADLTTAQDLGAVTELLSGAFFEPFGRSTSHQLWSSAMVVTPVLRGMFGIDVDALKHVVTVTPRLPADWPGAEVRRLRVGDAVVNLRYKREGAVMVVSVEGVSGPVVMFQNGTGVLRVPLPGVEVSVGHGLPVRGSRTAGLKVVDETVTGRAIHLKLEGQGGSVAMLGLRRNDAAARLRVEGAEVVGEQLRVTFPVGAGYVSQEVEVRW